MQSNGAPSRDSMSGRAAAMRSVPVAKSPSGQTALPPKSATWLKMRSSSVAT
jgi:hypothetical protein